MKSYSVKNSGQKLLIFLACFTPLFCMVQPSCSAQNIETNEQQHILKSRLNEVLKKNGLTVNSISTEGTQAIVDIDFPFDPQSSANKSLLNKLEIDLIQTNQFQPVTVIAKSDSIKINLTWNKNKHAIFEAIEDISK